MPAIQQAYDRYHDQGFEILAVNVLEHVGQVEAFAQELGLTFPILIDREGSVSNAYLVRSMPTTFFVDRSGVISKIVIGGPLSRAVIEGTIAPLLDEGVE
jgi:peroxiredoxin